MLIFFNLCSLLDPTSHFSLVPHIKNSPVFTLEKCKKHQWGISGDFGFTPLINFAPCTTVRGLHQFLCSPGPGHLAWYPQPWLRTPCPPSVWPPIPTISLSCLNVSIQPNITLMFLHCLKGHYLICHLFSCLKICQQHPSWSRLPQLSSLQRACLDSKSHLLPVLSSCRQTNSCPIIYQPPKQTSNHHHHNKSPKGRGTLHKCKDLWRIKPLVVPSPT